MSICFSGFIGDPLCFEGKSLAWLWLWDKLNLFAVRRPPSLFSACADSADIHGAGEKKSFFFFSLHFTTGSICVYFIPGIEACFYIIILTVFDF